MTYLKAVLHLWLMLLALSCDQKQPNGELYIRAPLPGNYEIYRVVGQERPTFSSEKIGTFNQSLELKAGRYLILADCSHRLVNINSGITEVLDARLIQFHPPHQPKADDFFTIQCSRYEPSKLRQRIEGRYTLGVVSTPKDLLIGMSPLRIESKDLEEHYQLAGIRVEPWRKDANSGKYFISPADSNLAATQSRNFLSWQYLLPGKYLLTVNGSQQNVDLKAGEARSIQAAGLILKSSDNIDLEQVTKISSQPYRANFGETPIALNTVYSMLPGPGKVSLHGSLRKHKVKLNSGRLTQLNIRTVQVNLNCTPWEWECLGHLEVNIFQNKALYPFLEYITDIPIPFFDKEIEIGLEGAPGLRYRIPKTQRDTVLGTATLTIQPQLLSKGKYITDLLRLEGVKPPIVGNSRDIPPGRSSRFILLPGWYTLARYTSNGADGTRNVSQRPFQLREGQHLYLRPQYYIPENKIQPYAKKQAQQLRHRQPDAMQRAAEGISIL